MDLGIEVALLLVEGIHDEVEVARELYGLLLLKHEQVSASRVHVI